MISIINKVLDIIKSITAKDLLYIIIICFLGWCIYSSHIKYSNMEDRYENNVNAFNDTISYYQSKTGELIAVKTAFECDIKDLEKINESLHSEIKDLKIKNDVLAGMNVSGKVEIPEVDTVYYVKYDTIYNGFKHDFNFNNEWRKLEGVVTYVPDSLRLNITKDEMYFDYTLAVDDKNQVYIKSSNPYVKYNDFTGFVIPSPKKPNFEWNIYANLEYNFNVNKVTPNVGTELMYKGISGFYEFDIINKHHLIGVGYRFKILNF